MEKIVALELAWGIACANAEFMAHLMKHPEGIRQLNANYEALEPSTKKIVDSINKYIESIKELGLILNSPEFD